MSMQYCGRRAVLLSKFVEGPADESLDYVAPILTNVTRQRAGRTLLLDPSRGFLRALASQLRSGGVMRRRGCAAALRNVCFGAQVTIQGIAMAHAVALPPALHNIN